MKGKVIIIIVIIVVVLGIGGYVYWKYNTKTPQTGGDGFVDQTPTQIGVRLNNKIYTFSKNVATATGVGAYKVTVDPTKKTIEVSSSSKAFGTSW